MKPSDASLINYPNVEGKFFRTLIPWTGTKQQNQQLVKGAAAKAKNPGGYISTWEINVGGVDGLLDAIPAGYSDKGGTGAGNYTYYLNFQPYFIK